MIFITGTNYEEIKQFANDTDYDPRYFTLCGLKELKPAAFKLDIKKIKKIIKGE